MNSSHDYIQRQHKDTTSHKFAFLCWIEPFHWQISDLAVKQCASITTFKNLLNRFDMT